MGMRSISGILERPNAMETKHRLNRKGETVYAALGASVLRVQLILAGRSALVKRESAYQSYETPGGCRRAASRDGSVHSDVKPCAHWLSNSSRLDWFASRPSYKLCGLRRPSTVHAP